ncbi:DMT family transporter [Actinomadura namibiensis]|uniref:Drug/metabolite transporter (DMT)-like permease n=1 Tax=Actinomadura namibiensis TaxID=182080 RepID=A0A7W3LT62_ACTNM|nr:DMT family transporter [Actinomadura namibiensis]MBA8953866.1 drug/metabolite transporter (DMT)-like permease [Actinomadura namibiensis]
MTDAAGRTGAMARVGVLALLWGSTFLWIELALKALSPVQVTLARCLLGTGTLLVLCLVSRRGLPRGRAVWAHLFVAAFWCNALPFAMYSLGQQTVDSGLAGVLNATTPLWSLLLGIAIGTERGVRPVRLGGLLLGFGGVVLILAPWQGTTRVGWGAFAIVVAAASYAVGFAHMGRHLVGRGHPTLSLSTAQLMAATALTSLSLPAGGLEPVHFHPVGLAAVVVLGICATGITFHLTYRVIADEGATNAATVGYLLPVVSVGLGALVLDEPFSLRVAVGMAVVLAGVGMTRRAKPAPPPAAPRAAPAVAAPARPEAHRTTGADL